MLSEVVRSSDCVCLPPILNFILAFHFCKHLSVKIKLDKHFLFSISNNPSDISLIDDEEETEWYYCMIIISDDEVDEAEKQS